MGATRVPIVGEMEWHERMSSAAQSTGATGRRVNWAALLWAYPSLDA